MTIDRSDAETDALVGKLDQQIGRIDAPFDRIDSHFDCIDSHFDRIDVHFDHIEMRLQNIERHMATKSNVSVAVFQAVGVLYFAMIATVVGLNAIGAFG